MSTTYVPAALREQVRQRAGGRCEYCRIPESHTLTPHEVDHVVAEKHGGATEADNLALSCALCNKHKGTDLTSIDPVTGDVVQLFHPRRDRWADHFQLNEGRVVPLSSIGRTTVRLLQLNTNERIAERELLIEAGLLPLK